MQNKTPNKKRRSGQQVKSPENLNIERITGKFSILRR